MILAVYSSTTVLKVSCFFFFSKEESAMNISGDKLHHLQCTPDDLGGYVLLPGDPDRVPVIADYLDDAQFVNQSREFCIYTGHLAGEAVSVVSTGIGCPSAAIAMEELVRAGAHTFLRVGTCGCMNTAPRPGDCIIATGAIRRDGTSRQYLPLEFPAVPDYEIVNALVDSARKCGQTYHLGIIETKDSYYGQHDPDASPLSHELRTKWEAFVRGGAIGSEMESAVLFILGSIYNVRVGSILHVARNRVQEEAVHSGAVTDFDTQRTIETAIHAVRTLISKEGR